MIKWANLGDVLNTKVSKKKDLKKLVKMLFISIFTIITKSVI